jgi:hypothetical protein
MCHGTPPTSAASQPGGAGARPGSALCSSRCRSASDSLATSAGEIAGGGARTSPRVSRRIRSARDSSVRGTARASAVTDGSRAPRGSGTSAAALLAIQRRQPSPLRATHSPHAASHSASIACSIRTMVARGGLYL